MTTSRSLWIVGCALALGAVVGACDLNPQPLPPGFGGGDKGSDNNGTGAPGDGATAGEPPPIASMDAGTQSPDAAHAGDAEVPLDASGTDAPSDSGDAGDAGDSGVTDAADAADGDG